MNGDVTTIPTDRIVGRDRPQADRAHDLRAGCVLRTAVGAEYDILGGFDLHPTNGAVWKVRAHDSSRLEFSSRRAPSSTVSAERGTSATYPPPASSRKLNRRHPVAWGPGRGSPYRRGRAAVRVGLARRANVAFASRSVCCVAHPLTAITGTPGAAQPLAPLSAVVHAPITLYGE
jgi:hypothetical protein